MSLKFRYLLFIGILHLTLVVLVYHVLIERKWLFIASELLILLSLYFSYRLYRSFIKPLDLMRTGTNAISDGDFSVKYIKTGSQDMDGLVAVFNRMIDLLREERIQLEEQSYFVENLIEATPLGIIILDYDGNVSNINPAAKHMLSVHTAEELSNSAKKEKLTEMVFEQAVGASKIISINGVDKYKCQVQEVIHQGFKRKFILIDDLSRELNKTEKEAYGRIIRMMAHEVNNSMGAINSIVDTVIEFGFQDQKDDKLKSSLQLVKDRNLGLSKFMSNYASVLRLPKPHRIKFDLVALLKKCGQLYIPSAKDNNIEINFDFPSDRVSLHADPILLEQAVSNMIKNAKESIAENGMITLKCTALPVGFSIIDNGAGINPENAEKLFTPFFSTKVNGQGVGLMLIREILESQGATFKLWTDRETELTQFDVVFK